MTPDEQSSLVQADPAIEEPGATDGRDDSTTAAATGVFAEAVGESRAELNDASALPVSIAPYHDGSDASSPPTEAQDAPVSANAPTTDAGDELPDAEVTDNQDAGVVPSEYLSAQDVADPRGTEAIAPPTPEVELPFQATWVLHKLQRLADEAPLQAGEAGFDGLRQRLTNVAVDAVDICLDRWEGLSQARVFVGALATQGWIDPENSTWKGLIAGLERTDIDAELKNKHKDLEALTENVEALESDIAAAEQRKAAIDAEIKARHDAEWQKAEQRMKAQAEEQKARLDAALAAKKAEFEKQQGLLADLLVKKDTELKDLQERRAALNQEIADLRAGKMNLKSTTALTAMQQREMEQMRTANQELAAQKAALENEVKTLHFQVARGSLSYSGAVAGKSDGWQRLFEALKLTQTGLLYQVKHAVEEAEAVVAEAGKTGDKALEREARDFVRMWKPWHTRNFPEWEKVRAAFTAQKPEQSLQAFQKLYRDGVRGANKTGEIEQAQADVLNNAARVVTERAAKGYRDPRVQQQDMDRMRGYAGTAQELMQRSAGQPVQDEVRILVAWISDWYRSWTKAAGGPK